MENFSITSRLTTKEYAKIMFVGLYKKPGFILATLLGLYYMVTLILNYFNIANFYKDTPYFEIFCGLFLLVAPTLIVIIAVRQFISNPSFKNDITYTFSETGITVQGLTFKGKFVWAHIIKQKELGSFLILYHSKKAGNFIDKSKLTSGQLQFIKTKVRQR
jgi:hypothetical protein